MNKKLLILFFITPLLQNQLIADTNNTPSQKKPKTKIFRKADSRRKIKGSPRKKSYHTSEEDFKYPMFGNQEKPTESHGEKTLVLPTHLKKRTDISTIDPVESPNQENVKNSTSSKPDSSIPTTSLTSAKSTFRKSPLKSASPSKNSAKVNNKGGSNE